MSEQVDEELFISSLALAEIQRGMPGKPPGKERRELEEWLQDSGN
jgi:hypothetical protein